MSPRDCICVGATIAIVLAGIGPAIALAQSATEARTVDRVISLVPSATDLIVALGAADRLVARTDYDTDARIRALPSIGGPAQPGIETIVARQPDLVLLWRVGPGSHLGPRLEEFGIHTVALGTQTLGEMYETIDTLGVLLGRRSAADSLRQAIVDTLAAVRRTRTQPPVRVFYTVWHDPPMTTGPGTFIDELIRTAGGVSVYEDAPTRWPVVSLEVLVQRDPDVVLVPTDGSGVLTAATLCRSAVWRQVRAVRERRIVEIDARLLNRPGPRAGVVARQLSMLLDSVRQSRPAATASCSSS